MEDAGQAAERKSPGFDRRRRLRSEKTKRPLPLPEDGSKSTGDDERGGAAPPCGQQHQ